MYTFKAAKLTKAEAAQDLYKMATASPPVNNAVKHIIECCRRETAVSAVLLLTLNSGSETAKVVDVKCFLYDTDAEAQAKLDALVSVPK